MIFDRALTREEAQTVLEEVKSLLTLQRFHARALVQTAAGDGAWNITQWHLEVDHTTGDWYEISENGRVYEYRDGLMVYPPEQGQQLPEEARARNAPIGPVQLAFPELQLIWGAGTNDYWPMLVQRIGTHSIIITFEHGADPSMRFTLVIDVELGVVTRKIDGFSANTLLVDIEADRPIQRLVPERYPELEVIYPDY